MTRQRLSDLVRAFYSDLMEDELLGPLFLSVVGDKIDDHSERVLEFWSSAMLGTRAFRGNLFGKHMAIHGVERTHFVRWLGLWQKHTRRLFSPGEATKLQRVAGGIARNLYRARFGDLPDRSIVGDGCGTEWI
jgi:hemoglobin